MKRQKRKPITYLSLFLAVVVMLTAFSSCAEKSSSFTGFAMGSMLTAEIYADEPTAAELWDGISAAVGKADSLLSASNENSDIGKLSRSGLVTADSYTVGIVRDAITYCECFGQKIDITMGAATRLWGFSTDAPSVPDEDDLRTALATRDLSGVKADPSNNTIRVKEGQMLDLGAFGKGAACDEAYKVLRTDTSAAVISFGGTVLLFGEAPGKDGWRVGIRDPFGGANEYFSILRFDGVDTDKPVFLSTSGNYEKTFEVNGKIYHHILDPDTGRPVENGLSSVTVCTDAGMLSDALSTACFVNGLNDTTLQWIRSARAGAVFVFEDGRVYVTDELKDKLTLCSDRFTVTDNYDEE